MADVADTELLDYEEEEQTAEAGDTAAAANGTNGSSAAAAPAKKDAVKGTYVSIHSSGFRDFLLKPEILRAIVDCGFEHPSEGECNKEIRKETRKGRVRFNGMMANVMHVSLAILFFSSSARVHSPGRLGHGHPVSGQVRHGQDCGLRPRHAPADRAPGRTGLRDRHVPHEGARLPDQQGVREVLKVHVRNKGALLFSGKQRARSTIEEQVYSVVVGRVMTR
jgi:hypothetical protein